MAEVTYVEAVRLALREALLCDERVILLGQDVGFGGGAFRATSGLLDEFGPERVRDTPICEGAFTSVAVGLALEGFRPIVEYQFADFLTSGFTAIVNTAAKMFFRTGWAVPLVVRAPSGGGFAGGPFHSQNPEAWFLRSPGIKVVCPATVEDAGALLIAAVHDPNPVLFLEQKYLYTRLKGHFAPESSEQLRGAVVRRPGSEITIVSYGAALHLALDVAESLEGEGLSCEVIDLRVLCPLDFETVAASVSKTSRCVIVHEDYSNFGVGAELAARVANECFTDLDAPIGRVGARFAPIPFSPPLEEAVLPTRERIAHGVREVAGF